MYNHKNFYLFFTLILFVGSQQLIAQTNQQPAIVKPKRQYAFVLYGGVGVARYVADINTQGLRTDINRNFPNGTIRLMWHPNHRLRVGLETGFSNLYSYRVIDSANTIGRLNIKAIPILVVWSVPLVKRVNLFAGFGSYYLTTHLNYKGNVNSSAFSLGSLVAANYSQPINKKLNIATEIKWYNAFQTKDAQLAVQVQMIWKFFTY